MSIVEVAVAVLCVFEIFKYIPVKVTVIYSML